MEPRKACLLFLKTFLESVSVTHSLLTACWPVFSDVTTESSQSSSCENGSDKLTSKSVACINEQIKMVQYKNKAHAMYRGIA